MRRALAVAVLLCAFGGRARADLTGLFEPTFTNSDITIRDPLGVSRTTVEQWNQRYRLTLDQALAPQLKFSAGGNLDWTLGDSTTDGVRTEQDLKRWMAFGHLIVGSPFLSAGLNYDRSETDASTKIAGVRASPPSLVREAYSASVGWRPSELPTFDLRLSRDYDYDKQRQVADLVTDEANLAVTYRPNRQLDLAYDLRTTDATDRLHDVEQKALLNSGRFMWSDRLLHDRVNASVSYAVGNRLSSTNARGPGGTVETQQFPTAGLSAVETFPATPDKVTLTPNPALVDSNLTLSASVNIGFNPSLSGDRNPRDLGAQFGTALSTINTIYVYVDRQLPANISAAFLWTVWRSDDNVNWTPVSTSGAVQFGVFQNRFEIPIAQVDSPKYLKVTTQPLLASATVDREFADILVTELQFVLVQPASLVAREQSVTSGQFGATARYLINPTINLSYDTAFFLAHTNKPSNVTWSTLNGLSASRRLSRIWGISGRADRTDSDQGQGHESVTRGSVAMSADPLPTLGGTLTYNAQMSQFLRGTAITNGVSGFAHADLYEGLSASTTASYALGRNEDGQSTTAVAFAASATAVPNRVVSLSGTYSVSNATLSGGGLPDRSDHSSQLSAAATVTPFPALFASGGVTRIVTAGTGSTLVNVAASFSPFPRGDLLARFTYSETLETLSDTRVRQWGPGARWNIRRGWFLDVSYSVSATRAGPVSTDGNTLFADLVITYR